MGVLLPKHQGFLLSPAAHYGESLSLRRVSPGKKASSVAARNGRSISNLSLQVTKIRGLYSREEMELHVGKQELEKGVRKKS